MSRRLLENNEEIQGRKRALKSSTLCRLDPFIDSNGILRVGGRLRHATLEYGEKHPVLLPKKHHIADLVTRHYHRRVHHQGRQITHGAIRQAGYWLIGGHRTVAKELSRCVTCKKLRGPVLEQRMADLPADRTEVAPPFTNVGFDVFGPWMVHTRKTREGTTNSKRWGLFLTCLTSRAVHIEVLGVHGYKFLYLHSKEILCTSRSCFPSQVRPGNQFHRRKIRAGGRPERDGPVQGGDLR